MSDVIDISELKTGSLSIRKRKKCRHPRIVLDDVERTVTCRDCGASIAAFDVLMQWANKERSLCYRIDHLEKRAKEARAETIEVERKLKNAKARLRRAENR